MINPQQLPEERRGWFSRIKDGLLGVEELDEEEAMEAAPVEGTQRIGKTARELRLHTSRLGKVAVRLNAQIFDDAKLAADGLKSGEHQIVNLERASPQMAERIIDFLNGVTYAIDGTVERVGDKVYMFVPANISVEVDNGATAANSRRSTFGESH